MADRAGKTSQPILIVDDDPSVTASLALLLKQAGYASRTAASPAEALSLMESEAFAMVLQDMNFSRQTSGEEGLQLLKAIKARKPHLPVVLITAWGSIELAVQGVRAGASDFITKPWTHQQILQAVRTALGLAEAQSSKPQNKTLTRAELDARYDFGDLAGGDPKFLRVLELIGRIAATDASVLITGESGTGKELVAEAIHRNSHRRQAPLVKVNLGGIPATLFESEMFGHVRGAFTDAKQDRKGRFELANGGTIFLDEIGDLDPGSQVKLLRVLQDRTYEVLGSSQTRTVDVRVVSATNRNLAEMVAHGQFREDLLYRLNLIAIHLPSLRERPDDIPLIAARFLENLAKVYRRATLTIHDAALRWLQQQPWPGNVRQLRHVIERALLISGKDRLEKEDFETTMAMDARADSREDSQEVLPQVGAMTLDDLEKAMILKAMKHHGGNISRVADALGLSRAALYRRFEKFGIKT
ncbi:MAG TPA: sigma-54 dependent transcriptional regulator [Blastocatellia bacterium]|nr:sigma-54 dependent transcriptional regulator [Blastocatellia bacterium]HMY76028.1 sigma-54 dependent transcriptional regulator [Blastocatellia bacterium]HNG31959.1 sigma-54 dependent transcriptional regulator [Blastocatellia bacterium]